jgi:hypothetical protein
LMAGIEQMPGRILLRKHAETAHEQKDAESLHGSLSSHLTR